MPSCQALCCKAKTTVLLVKCKGCTKEFCLRHRHPEDHACEATPPPATSKAMPVYTKKEKLGLDVI